LFCHIVHGHGNTALLIRFKCLYFALYRQQFTSLLDDPGQAYDQAGNDAEQ